MAYGISLNYQGTTVYNANNLSGYRFTVQATNGNNLDNNIFRYTRQTFNYTTQDQADFFSGICSPEQINSVPIGAPSPSDPDQFYRLDSIDLIFDTRALADDAWAAIQSDVNLLITSLTNMDKLNPATVLRIGT